MGGFRSGWKGGERGLRGAGPMGVVSVLRAFIICCCLSCNWLSTLLAGELQSSTLLAGELQSSILLVGEQQSSCLTECSYIHPA